MGRKPAWPSLLFFILLCLGVEFISGYWTNQTVATWYPLLNKPSWTPPPWVFGPVWTILYVLISISGWLIYQAEDSPRRSQALLFYAGQLVVNFLWSFFFFSLRSPAAGLIDILFLDLLIALTIMHAWRVRALAAILLIPYLLWVLYATTLNAGIWLLNG